MNDFFEELFTYSKVMNEKVAELIQNNAAIVTPKSIELYSHILNAHHIWNNRILNLKPEFTVWQVHNISEFSAILETNHLHSISILKHNNLDKIITYQTSNGQSFANTVRDLLFQVINHSTYHRAQIATLLKEVGIAPPATDYIFFKR